MRFLLWLFVIIPVIEIVLLIQIGGQIGALATILWLIAAAAIGVTIIRFQGIATLMRAREMIAQGKAPGAALAHGLILAVAGVLLIIPGFASDAVAFICLIPALRQMLIHRWLRNLRVKTAYRGNIYDVESTRSPPAESDKIGRVLEGEYRHEDGDKK